MNFSKSSVLAAIALLSTLAVTYAKLDKSAEIKSDDLKKSSEGETVAKDAGGATSEGASSEFNIEELLKMIGMLGDKNFEGFEEMVKGVNIPEDKNEDPSSEPKIKIDPKKAEAKEDLEESKKTDSKKSEPKSETESKAEAKDDKKSESKEEAMVSHDDEL